MSSQPHMQKFSHSEPFFVKIRSVDGVFFRPKLVALKLMYVLCYTVFSDVILFSFLMLF
jgi:hypothetical protein